MSVFDPAPTGALESRVAALEAQLATTLQTVDGNAGTAAQAIAAVAAARASGDTAGATALQAEIDARTTAIAAVLAQLGNEIAARVAGDALNLGAIANATALVEAMSRTGVGRVVAQWTQLSPVIGAAADGALVLGDDGGSHHDPITGQEVPNAGAYSYIVQVAPLPSGWHRVANLPALDARAEADLARGWAAQEEGEVDPDEYPGLLSALQYADLARVQRQLGEAAARLTALAGSTNRYYHRAAGTAQITSQYRVGRFYDVGVELAAGDIFNAVEVETACPATAVTYFLRVWKRPLLVGGVTNPNLNATWNSANDVLVGTYSYVPAAPGLLTTNKRVIITFPDVTTESGYSYGIERYAVDGSAAVLTVGYGRAVNSTYNDARFRGISHTTAVGGFSAVPATFEMSDGLLRSGVPIVQANLSSRINTAVAGVYEKERAGARQMANMAMLLASAGRFALTVPGGGIVFIGDSNTRQLPGAPVLITPGNKIAERLADYIPAPTTITNKGLPAQNSTTIRSFCQQAEGTTGPVGDPGVLEPALTAAQRAMLAVSMVGTNDIVSAGVSATILANSVAIDAVFAGNVLHRGYPMAATNSVGSLGWAESRRCAANARTQFGARYLDTQYAMAFAASLTGSRDNIRRGKMPPEFVQADGLHFNNGYSDHGALSLAGPVRAMCGGPAYVHDDTFAIRGGDAAGTAIGTVRVLGTFYAGQLRILSGNNDDIVRLDGTTGALTRGAGAMADDIRVVEVQCGARSNVAQIILMRCADGTAALTGVRVKPNPASMLSASLTGVVDGPEQTIAMCVKLNGDQPSTGLFHQGAGTTALIAVNGRAFTYNAYNTANTLRGQRTAPEPATSLEYNWYFFGRKADGTIVARTNKGAATSLTGSGSDNMPISQLYSVWGNSPTGGGNLDLSFRSVMMFSSFIDFTVDATVDLFRNPANGLPMDLGAAGTVSGVTPYLWLRGNARDAAMGMNYGTGGALYGAIIPNREDMGFEDDPW